MEEWFEKDGAVILLMVDSLVTTRQYRGLNTRKVDLLVANITAIGYLRQSVITVQLVGGVYFVVDGVHRVMAALECILRGTLDAGSKVAAMVLKEATPETLVVAYAAKLNVANAGPAPIQTYAEYESKKARRQRARGGKRKAVSSETESSSDTEDARVPLPQPVAPTTEDARVPVPQPALELPTLQQEIRPGYQQHVAYERETESI